MKHNWTKAISRNSTNISFLNVFTAVNISYKIFCICLRFFLLQLSKKTNSCPRQDNATQIEFLFMYLFIRHGINIVVDIVAKQNICELILRLITDSDFLITTKIRINNKTLLIDTGLRNVHP